VAQTIHSLLTPENVTLVLVDYQPQMGFATKSIETEILINNAVGLAKAASVFKVPTILTTVETESFSGKTFTALSDALPGAQAFERTSMNFWEDRNVVSQIEKIGRKKLLLGGLWTEVCIVMPTIQALEAGYEVYVVTDACGATSQNAQEMSILRVVQAGAVPVTWLQVMLEWQRDWARQATYKPVMDIAKTHAGAYGIGIEYAQTMLKPLAQAGKA